MNSNFAKNTKLILQIVNFSLMGDDI